MRECVNNSANLSKASARSIGSTDAFCFFMGQYSDLRGRFNNELLERGNAFLFPNKEKKLFEEIDRKNANYHASGKYRDLEIEPDDGTPAQPVCPKHRSGNH